MKLSKRLEKIIELLDKCDTIADIGCDHAYVAIELAHNRVANNVIASDISKGAIDIANNNINIIKEYIGMDCSIETRLGNGLNILSKNEADTIILSGMGGELICDILGDIDEYTFDSLILAPHSKLYELRNFLHSKKISIIKEDIIHEKKKYYF